MDKLPFEITPQIQRYLEDILYLHDEWINDNNALYLIKEELEKYEKTSSNNEVFWKYLKDQQVATVLIGPINFREIKKTIGSTPTSKLVAVARTHEMGKIPVEKFYVKKEHWEQDLKKVAHDISFGEYIVLRVLKIELVAEMLDKIKYASEEIVKNPEITEQVQDKNKDIQPITLPEGTKWENITIRFIDNNDNVEISVKGKTIRTVNFVEMGFEDNKKKRPDFQWDMLQLLAYQKGELSWKSDLNAPIKERNKYKKRIQKLKDILKKYFEISESPFYGYKKEGAYKIKINLIPSTSDQPETRILRTHENYKDGNGVSKEVREYLDENAPIVDEKPRKYDNDY